jgi:hypothetical protein
VSSHLSSQFICFYISFLKYCFNIYYIFVVFFAKGRQQEIGLTSYITRLADALLKTNRRLRLPSPGKKG